MTFHETLPANFNLVTDHSFLETTHITGQKINPKSNPMVLMEENGLKEGWFSVDGSMVGVDLGTRIVKVNISKIQKDHNPVEDIDVPLDPAALASADSTANSAAIAAKDARATISKTTCRTDDFANTTDHW